MLRGVIDRNRREGHQVGMFLLLGSASLDIVLSAGESLAGRAEYLHLPGVNVDEATAQGFTRDQLWLRGGFPAALTAATDPAAFRWLGTLIQSYVTRDIPMFDPKVPPATIERLWRMIASQAGGLLNVKRFAENLMIGSRETNHYLDLLDDLGMVRRLEPWHANIGKRLTKSPKLYVRDTGVLHRLLEIQSFNQLLSHVQLGASFESFAVESLINAAPGDWHPYFYRTQAGAEIDLVFERGGAAYMAIEIKYSPIARPARGFHNSVADLEIDHLYQVHSGDAAPFQEKDLTIIGLLDMVETLRTWDAPPKG
jgi:predicted AAA+ superfamily ATPase